MFRNCVSRMSSRNYISIYIIVLQDLRNAMPRDISLENTELSWGSN